MKILYGVQGTGNGHIARARVMAKALARRVDVEVDFIFTGREPDKYFDMEVFGNYRTFKGLTFITDQGKVSKWKTLQQASLKQLIQDVRSLDLSDYDLLLNDFEPVTAWAAKLAELDSISVSHQAAFKHNIPKQGEQLADKLLMRFFAPCDINLGVHWYHFGYPIMPPFIEESLRDASQGEHVLVYLPFEDINQIQQLLSHFPEQPFICYHPDITLDQKEGNINWRKPSKAGFQQDLFSCHGVIANGGFELSSECLQLGKKILIKPLLGQYEQTSNRITLEQMQRCMSMNTLDPETLRAWLPTESPHPIGYPSNPDTFIDWLLEENWYETQSLCDALWQQTVIPASVLSSLSPHQTSNRT